MFENLEKGKSEMQSATEQKIKYTSATATKIVLAIEEALKKVKVVGCMSTLVSQTCETIFDVEVETAKTQYEELTNNLKENQERLTEESYFIKLSDKMLFYINEWSLLDWSSPVLIVFEPENAVDGFYSNFEDFFSIVINILTTTARELNREQRFIEKCSKFLVKNDEIIAKLEKKLPKVRTSKDHMIKEKQLLINEIDEKINLLCQFSQGEILLLRDKRDVRIRMIEQRNEDVVQKLKGEEESLVKEVSSVRLANEKTHKDLRQRSQDLKMCISWIIDKYDETMTELQHKFDETWKEFSSEMERCRSLCIHYNDIKDIAYTLQVEKRKKFEAEVKERLRLRVRDRAARTIQAFWRRILEERKAKKLEKKQKSKQKKKKKK